MAISLNDIAKEAGVSTATVSLVLSGKASDFGIAKATRENVLKVARRLRYRPNLAARGLRKGRTYVVGLLFNNPRELIYAELLSCIQTELHHRGYAGICAFWETMSGAPEAFGSVIDRGVDALITSHDDLSLIPDSVPAVLLFQTDDRHDSVNRDGVAAMRLAAHHLLDLGHRRLGVVDLNRETHEALLADALRERDLDLAAYWTYDEDDVGYRDGVMRCMEEILSLPPDTRPTGLICRNDTAAMIAISEAGRRGLRVPHDLSVIGFDAVSMGAIANPPLTSVGVDPAELACRAVALLIRRLNDSDAPCERIVLQPELITRASCAPPSGSSPRARLKPHV